MAVDCYRCNVIAFSRCESCDKPVCRAHLRIPTDEVFFGERRRAMCPPCIKHARELRERLRTERWERDVLVNERVEILLGDLGRAYELLVGAGAHPIPIVQLWTRVYAVSRFGKVVLYNSSKHKRGQERTESLEHSLGRSAVRLAELSGGPTYENVASVVYLSDQAELFLKPAAEDRLELNAGRVHSLDSTPPTLPENCSELNTNIQWHKDLLHHARYNGRGTKNYGLRERNGLVFLARDDDLWDNP